MNEYALKITRTRTDVGYVTIPAESEEDALRKYWVPEVNKGEHLIFDDEINWFDLDGGDYKAEIYYATITRDEAIIRWCNNKPVLLIHDDGTEAYVEKIEDILYHKGSYGYEVED